MMLRKRLGWWIARWKTERGECTVPLDEIPGRSDVIELRMIGRKRRVRGLV